MEKHCAQNARHRNFMMERLPGGVYGMGVLKRRDLLMKTPRLREKCKGDQMINNIFKHILYMLFIFMVIVGLSNIVVGTITLLMNSRHIFQCAA